MRRHRWKAFASICGILVIGLFALTFIFQNFVIPSSSMEKTLLIGDHVMVDRITLAPPANWAPFVHYRNVQRGDIIVFFKPGEPDLFLVKRVIGIPGDHIHLRAGTVYLNGQPQNESYAAKADYSNYLAYRDDFPAVPTTESTEVTPNWADELPTRIQGDDLVVPAGHYFAMGDNRPMSLDFALLGFCATREYCRASAFQLLVVHHAGERRVQDQRWRSREFHDPHAVALL